MITGTIGQITHRLIARHLDVDEDLIAVDNVEVARHPSTFVVRVTFLAEPPECNVSEFRVDIDTMEVIQL